MIWRKTPSSQSILWGMLQEARGEISSDYLEKPTTKMPKVGQPVVAAKGDVFFCEYFLCFCIM